MKIRNKKMLTALVTCFAVVVLAGGAFALLVPGSLVFWGAVDVTADLRVDIMSMTASGAEDSAGDPITVVIGYDIDPGGQAAEIYFPPGHVFTPGDTFFFEFELENVGTLPARIQLGTVLPYPDDAGAISAFITWTPSAVDNSVLSPGGLRRVRFDADIVLPAGQTQVALRTETFRVAVPYVFAAD